VAIEAGALGQLADAGAWPVGLLDNRRVVVDNGRADQLHPGNDHDQHDHKDSEDLEDSPTHFVYLPLLL
jgi:hypothetical protein